jgi:hypothetical protein
LINCEFYSSTDELREFFDIEGEILDGLVSVLNQFSDLSDYLDKKMNTSKQTKMSKNTLQIH